jgi:hypothetical protein
MALGPFEDIFLDPSPVGFLTGCQKFDGASAHNDFIWAIDVDFTSRFFNLWARSEGYGYAVKGGAMC